VRFRVKFHTLRAFLDSLPEQLGGVLNLVGLACLSGGLGDIARERAREVARIIWDKSPWQYRRELLSAPRAARRRHVGRERRIRGWRQVRGRAAGKGQPIV